MPAYYDYRCTQCSKTERRYRNVKRCRWCRGDLERIEPPTYDEIKTSLDFYKARVSAFDAMARHMPEPWQTWAFNIIANGRPDVWNDVPWEPAQQRPGERGK